MNFKRIDVSVLVAEAGGDPWQINTSIQRGRPSQVADLAQTFHDAGSCATEADHAFLEACRRFEASWNRENGDHPINDSAEVQRATQSLGVQAAQLPRIGVDLENIAAALAEAQRTCGGLISTLDNQLHEIDNELDYDLNLEQQSGLSAAQKHDLDQRIGALAEQAVTDTQATLHQVESIHDGYSGYLQNSLTTLRTEDGYDPAPLQGLDDDGRPVPGEQGQAAVDNYGGDRRARDQALVDSPGPMTADKADAAARLRDYATATNPASDTDARRLASERLDDFHLARVSGPPLPADPILGIDPRGRAQLRLEMQKRYEQGSFGDGRPMTPDQATQLLDDAEQHGRVLAIQQAVKGLESQGMSHEGAKMVVGDIARGMPWAEIAKQHGQMLGLGGAGVDGTAAARGARHAVGAFTPADLEGFEKVGKLLGKGGTAIDLALAINDYMHGAGLGETVGKATGGIAGGWFGATGGGALAGTTLGPEGAFVGGVIGAALFALGGEKAGGAIGRLFDQ